MKLSKILIWAGTIWFLYFTGMAQAAIFGSDEKILWESGKNLYIKLDKIEKSAGKSTNDHPVALNKTEIFRQLDEAMMARSVEHRDNLEKLQVLAKEGRKELEDLFKKDSAF